MRQMRFYRPIMRRIRDYNITKKEWVLNGETVISVADSRIRRGKYQNDGSVFYQIKPSRASELLKEMLECGIVEPVSGTEKESTDSGRSRAETMEISFRLSRGANL